MSIEKDLKRIADALKANTEMLQKLYDLKAGNAPVAAPAVAPPIQPVATPVPTSPVNAAPVPVATPTQPTIAPTVAPAPVTVMSAEEMNAALVAEFKRLGGREQIDATLTSFGITSVNDCPAEKQQEVLTAIRALQP